MIHDTHPTPPTHTPHPIFGGCEEDLSNERRGLLHRGHTYIQIDGHCDSMTESAQWADSVKIVSRVNMDSEEGNPHVAENAL